ncbi:9338_t:CDS:2 [Ambispora leptoticha]|uniref:9338_t:CDS:1 n=1 Tax=Ambispora leptoticha TaxID=144679 RepID=A0A9N8ZH71_9GLOM|nr:9338_t:CDS:2 [Ambispora leptoticha]
MKRDSAAFIVTSYAHKTHLVVLYGSITITVSMARLILANMNRRNHHVGLNVENGVVILALQEGGRSCIPGSARSVGHYWEDTNWHKTLNLA